MKQTLRNLMADGKTARALDKLRQLNLNDDDLNTQITLLSARFKKNESQKNNGVIDERDFNLELNRINIALLAVIDQLDVNQIPPSVSESSTSDDSVSNAVVVEAKTSKQGFSWTKWTGLNDVKSWIAAVAGVLAIMTFYFKYCGHVSDNGDGKPFSVVIYTHGNGGKQDIIQLKDTKLVADFGGRREVSKVGENNQNIFAEIPATFSNRKIGIGLQGTEGYVLKYPDSLYLLNGEPIYLAVTLGDNARLIKGVVKTQNGDLLESVVVTTVGESSLTDAKGYFTLSIPANKQQPSYPLTLTRKGYRTANETYIPQNQTAEYRLTK